jgi:SAM-dependent methyltransferase
MTLRSLVPWYVRIGAKVVLSRLPAGYAFWRRLGVFSHGDMDDPAYAHRVFLTHFDRSPFARKGGGFVGLELGPGDSAMSAVVAAAYGARRHHLIDAGRFATADPAPYRVMSDHLRSLGLVVPDLSGASDLDEILNRCHANYGTQGLDSLRSLADGGVDFIWSQAVLEHVRRGDFLDTMRELHRVLRPDGVCSHRVDLKDHLGGALSNLRVDSSLWEREWLASSGFYTNRLRFSEMIDLFSAADFAVEVVGVNRWEASPIRRSALATEFRGLDDDDLLIKEFDVLLRRASSQ